MPGSNGYAITWVTENLAVGGAPMSYESLAVLRQEGVDCVLNLCAEFCDLHWIEADEGFEVYYLPIPDEETPDLVELEKALDWMDEAIYLGKRVLIHCRHGIGRTGTVLNSYLLRKGLGHKMAGRTLKHLRSKPQNFSQWRFVRRYGKQSGRLTVREPSLETKNLVDLYPFFADYERAVEDVDVLLEDGRRCLLLCGRDHDHCCTELVTMSFIEAVYLNHAVTMTLGRKDREAVTERAVEHLRALRRLGYVPGEQNTLTASVWQAYREQKLRCPLNEMGECLIFDSRPLACRLSDLDAELPGREDIPTDLPETMRTASNNLFFALTSRFPQGTPMAFSLPEVVSGKFVQTFFHALMQLDES